MPVRALVVVNPNATATRRRTRDLLLAALAGVADTTVATTTHRDHARDLAAQARRDGVDVVIAYGGDGTVNEVVNGLLVDGPASEVPVLGVLPGGSANVFARNLGLPAEPMPAASHLIRVLRNPRRLRSIGLGRANGRWFTFNAGLGLDAETVRIVENARHRGKRATPGLYVRSAVRSYVGQERATPLLSGDLPGGEQLPEMFLALVTNCSPWTYLGPVGIRTAPRSSFEAGLDLVGTTSMGILPLLKHVAEILVTRRGPRGPDVVHRHDLPWLTLHAQRKIGLQVDGDYLGATTVLHCTAVPDAVRVLV
jgi:diacylglycerol kinase family enzyme